MQFPVTVDGVPIPLTRPAFAGAQQGALSTTPTAALSLNAAGKLLPVRLFAIGCDMLYRFGTSGVAAPTVAASGYVPKDGVIDTYMLPADTHATVVAVTGTGTYRIEPQL